MPFTKRFFSARFFFIVEMIALTLYSLFGSSGIFMIQDAQKAYKKVQKEIQETQETINRLQNQVNDWKKYPFFKEQLAREQLQMARKNEVVYYFPH
jgi:cell division protein FtsB